MFLCGLSPSYREQGLLFIAVHRLLIAVASPVAEYSLKGARASVVVACGLWSTGSIVVVHRFSCSVACGIFPDQGLNPCLLLWREDSFQLSHQGSPTS